MNIYRKEISILSSDTDMNRVLRLSALFTYLQEAAIEHTRQLGAGKEYTLDRGLLWIVAQQQLKISRLPVYDEKVILLSWPGKTMHLFFPRFWQLTDMDGQVLLSASSIWGLMDQDTRSLAFPEEYGIVIEDMSQGRDSSLPKRIKAQQAPDSGTFTVPYSYLDLNRHMNNARYFDLATDHMPDAFRARPISGINAEYIGEAVLQDVLTLRSLAGEDSWYFAGETDRPVFRIVFSF